MENSQNRLWLTIETKTDIIEFIEHRDLHLYVYFNGFMSDIRLPRHIKEQVVYDYEATKNPKRIIDNLVFGASKYNKKRIKKVFSDFAPEYFV